MMIPKGLLFNPDSPWISLHLLEKCWEFFTGLLLDWSNERKIQILFFFFFLPYELYHSLGLELELEREELLEWVCFLEFQDE